MKKIYFTLLALFTVSLMSAQLIAKVEMKEKVEGICNQNEVYGLFSGFGGQTEAQCSLTKKEIEDLLNQKVDFISKNPKYKDKGMVGCYINCEGKALEWEIDVKTKTAELDQQILEVFKTISNWKAGVLNNKNVDSRVLYSYKIKKGHLTLN